ncbi:ribonuclease E/G [Halobacillus sp. Nhm2S1]|uniref:ribonuclease E/G n=1 Tax=Halobacillus sp. Nhm2S1 TaxID=2866716 RepID=UPI001C7391B4|nr:ribonuclease E/G [Halobacillus sp. Nhm2S1]MBX0358858.1 ribonuclease E/G [Halobacillus sp. Nhm2S1]
MRQLLLHTKAAEKSGVVIENGEILEYVIDRPGAEKLTGSIFFGKVERVEQGLDAAFIDIGAGRSGFLRKEMVPWCEGKLSAALNVGQRVIVQVIKDPVGNKGAQLTADVTLPGLYTVYQPFAQGKISISRKLESEKRAEIESWLENELKNAEGCIIRTAAGDVDPKTIIEELRGLRDEWKTLDERKKNQIYRLWSEPSIPNAWIRKFPATTIQEVLIDDAGTSKRLKEKFPSLAERIRWESDMERKLPVSLSRLQEQIISPLVELNNGVSLVIEETEAMTVIDVNSHKVKGRSFSNSQALDVNILAAKEIQKQVRLRNLSGIILIDFISMKNENNEKQLISEMRRLVKSDPTKTNVFGMTRLGLLEMTRKRENASLTAQLAKSREVSFTDETALYRLERELLQKREAEALMIAVHPTFMDCKKRLLSEPISSKIPQELFVRQDADISGYQIELEGSLDMIREAVQRRGYHVDNLF